MVAPSEVRSGYQTGSRQNELWTQKNRVHSPFCLTPAVMSKNMNIPSKEELKGMTVNERLFSCNLFDEWDVAVKNRNKDEMIKILSKVELTQEQALETTNTILENPKKYGF